MGCGVHRGLGYASFQRLVGTKVALTSLAHVGYLRLACARRKPRLRTQDTSLTHAGNLACARRKPRLRGLGLGLGLDLGYLRA